MAARFVRIRVVPSTQGRIVEVAALATYRTRNNSWAPGDNALLPPR